MTNEKIDTDDLILQQPEHIVYVILSFLDFKNIVRTSILSKRWRNLWMILSPGLDFTVWFYNVASPRGKSKDEVNAIREKLMNYVEQVLRVRHSRRPAMNLSYFALDVRFYDAKVASWLDRCIGQATRCNVAYLCIAIMCYDEGGSHGKKGLHNFSPTVFAAAAKSLTELSLVGCNLESSSYISSYIKFSSLKTLSLSSTGCMDYQIIQNIIERCPLIERLRLANCPTKGVLKISSPQLDTIQIYGCDFGRVEIEVPHLKTFWFDGEKSTRPCEIIVLNCGNLTELRLYSVASVTNKSFNDLLSKVPLLESLQLHNCHMLETVKISNSQLKQLIVYNCKKVVKVEIDDPNLTCFDYSGGWNNNNMISFSSNALDLSVSLSLHPRNLDNLWYVNLIAMLGMFNHLKVLTLCSDIHENVIVPKELRASFLPPLYDVGHLVVDLNEEKEAIKEILDGLLWLSPHLSNLIISSMDKERQLELNFVYNEIEGEENSCGCFSLPITCWRHSIVEVENKRFEDFYSENEDEGKEKNEDEDERDIKSFLEHTKMVVS